MKNLLVIIIGISFQILSAQSLEKVDVRNGSMHYISAGDGEIIVFVHGLQEDYRVFLPQLELLDEKFEVVTYSRRYNFPNTNELGENFSGKTESEDLKALVNSLGEPVHLVGHSYGGLVAVEFALSNPDLVKSLVLSEPALIDWIPSIPDCPISYEEIQENHINDTREAFKTGDTSLILKELFEFCAGVDIQDELPPEILDMLKTNLREVEAFVNSKYSLKSPAVTDLKGLKMPVMIITAEKTLPMLKCTNEKLLKVLPDASQHHFSNAGHEIWMTRPEELAGYITTFLLP